MSSFFEWNRKSSHKQPYFIHFADITPTEEMIEVSMNDADVSPSEKEGHMESVVSDKVSTKEHEKVISGRILTMAGLFDVWRGSETVR